MRVGDTTALCCSSRRERINKTAVGLATADWQRNTRDRKAASRDGALLKGARDVVDRDRERLRPVRELVSRD
jgi:hypothetical protein